MSDSIDIAEMLIIVGLVSIDKLWKTESKSRRDRCLHILISERMSQNFIFWCCLSFLWNEVTNTSKHCVTSGPTKHVCHFFQKLSYQINHSIKNTPKMNHRITEPQNVRGWKGPLWVTPTNPPAEAGSPRAGCTGPRPGGAGISPEKETPQPPWAACSSALSPSGRRSSSSCSDETFSASVCAHCPLSCRWAPLERAWPHPPDTHPSDIYGHL